MNYMDFLFYKYRDNVIMVTKFRQQICRDYGLDRDDANRLCNRIFDYQKEKYGDVLDGTFYEHTMEELKRINLLARTRRNNQKRYKERR